MTNKANYDELFQAAEKSFQANKYVQAEPLLNQLVLKGYKKAFVFHMLGTIYYHNGKFNRAIRAFKRAIEIDPSLTDASIGLSIILNDLGRYKEGQKVFHEAQFVLGRKKKNHGPDLNEKLSEKHSELGDLYFKHDRVAEALEQFQRALSLSTHKPELTMKIVECHIQEGDRQKTVHLLRTLCRDFPKFVEGRLKLGKLYYDFHKVPDAILQWEQVLRVDPENTQAKEYLKLIHSMDTIHTLQDAGL